jgi:hypothetical protein
MSELGELLELLHGAQEPFETLSVTYRVWAHTERAMAASMADANASGASVASGLVGPDSEGPYPVEIEQTIRIWRAPNRARVERGEGKRSYGVRVGELWWEWRDGEGASSNEDDVDGQLQSNVGMEMQPLLDPTLILGALHLRVTRRGERAGRKTITVQAGVRRGYGDLHRRRVGLGRLGIGADRYVIDVDAQRGVLLWVEALRDGEAFQRIEAVEIAFDEPLDDELFVLHRPSGGD